MIYLLYKSILDGLVAVERRCCVSPVRHDSQQREHHEEHHTITGTHGSHNYMCYQPTLQLSFQSSCANLMYTFYCPAFY